MWQVNCGGWDSVTSSWWCKVKPLQATAPVLASPDRCLHFFLAWNPACTRIHWNLRRCTCFSVCGQLVTCLPQHSLSEDEDKKQYNPLCACCNYNSSFSLSFTSKRQLLRSTSQITVVEMWKVVIIGNCSQWQYGWYIRLRGSSCAQ